jgi:hypothetical protein
VGQAELFKMVNTHIVVAVVVITVGGFLRFWTGAAPTGTSGTSILMGAYLLLLVLSVADLLGEPFSTIAGAIAMLAALVTLFTQYPWQALFGGLNAKQAGTIVQPANLQNPKPKPVEKVG